MGRDVIVRVLAELQRCDPAIPLNLAEADVAGRLGMRREDVRQAIETFRGMGYEGRS